VEPTGDRTLTAWAAECVEHALGQFPDFADSAAETALAAARGWAQGGDDLDPCRDAAYEAHLSARGLSESGYQAAAVVVRAASNAAASADDSALAEVAAAYCVEALTLNSAPCEQQFNGEAERRWQWEQLPEPAREAVFDAEPPEPGPAACAL
jgi:hypothetical protein